MRIRHPIPTHLHRHIVATMLALDSHLRGDPPNGRVIEEQCLGDALQAVDEVVVSSHVRQLVRNDGVELIGRQASERGCREEQCRLQPSDDGRNVYANGVHESNVAPNPEPSRQPSYAELQALGHFTSLPASHAFDGHPVGEQARRQSQHTDEPGSNDEWQPGFNHSLNRHHHRIWGNPHGGDGLGSPLDWGQGGRGLTDPGCLGRSRGRCRSAAAQFTDHRQGRRGEHCDQAGARDAVAGCR